MPGAEPTRVVVVTALLSIVAFGSGCAVIMATRQPPKKDLTVLTPGVPRARVIAELGSPLYSEDRGGVTTDIFAFKQGYSKGVKAGRALVHGAADVMTFGLWEVVGTPAEAIANGTHVKVEVQYDNSRNIQTVQVMEGDKVLPASLKAQIAASPRTELAPAFVAEPASNTTPSTTVVPAVATEPGSTSTR